MTALQGLAMPRFYHPGWLFEVARRTQRGEDLFDAGDAGQVDAIVGIFAEAQRRHAVEIFHLHFMSNHYHGLFRAPSATRMARFLNFVHGEIAKLVNRSRQNPGAVWSGKFTPLPVTNDDRTLMARMAYITAQALRARLVEHPRQFSGVSALGWLLSGVPLVGRYGSSRSAPARGTVTGPNATMEAGASGDPRLRRVDIAKLPGFEDRSWPELHALFAAMADELAGRNAQGAGHVARSADVAVGDPTDSGLGGMEVPPADDGARDRRVRSPGGPVAPVDGRAAAAQRCGGEPTANAHKQEGAFAQAYDDPLDLWSVPVPAADPGRSTPAVSAPLSGARAGAARPIRGPVKPKTWDGRWRHAKLRVLSCSVDARTAYLEAQAWFGAAYAAAMVRFQRRLRRCPAGVRWCGSVVFPPHALLPGGLAPP